MAEVEVVGIGPEVAMAQRLLLEDLEEAERQGIQWAVQVVQILVVPESMDKVITVAQEILRHVV
jgi:hypothetical protein